MAETALYLRCPLEQCDSMTITAPSGGYSAGDMIMVNDTVGVVVEDADDGDDVAMIYNAPKILVPCAAAATAGYAAGEKVYFDETNAEVTEESSGNVLCGIVLEDSDAGDETVLIQLMGTLGIVS